MLGLAHFQDIFAHLFECFCTLPPSIGATAYTMLKIEKKNKQISLGQLLNPIDCKLNIFCTNTVNKSNGSLVHISLWEITFIQFY